MGEYMNFTGIRELWKDRRRRKPYLVALLLALLYIGDIFFLSGILGLKLGIAGTVVHELILAGMGVGVLFLFRGKLKVIFPFKKPQWAKLAGTVILWLGTYYAVSLITMIMAFFFPEQVLGASQGVDELISAMPVLPSLFVVAVVPAVCEELAFRGALLSCFRGAKNKWIGIIIVSLFFGACHGSVWRMVPTALLGAAMGYILLETENILYTMLFHFVNNAFPVLYLGIMVQLTELFHQDIWEMANGVVLARIPLASVGSCMTSAGAAPILIYIGNYFLHRGQPGYDKGIFPPEKKKLMAVMIGAGVGLMLIGTMLTVVSVGLETAGSMRWIF